MPWSIINEAGEFWFFIIICVLKTILLAQGKGNTGMDHFGIILGILEKNVGHRSHFSQEDTTLSNLSFHLNISLYEKLIDVRVFKDQIPLRFMFSSLDGPGCKQGVILRFKIDGSPEYVNVCSEMCK